MFGNYATHDGLVNGANGIFQGSTKVFNSQEVIWILFNNPKCGQFTRIKNIQLYEHEIHPTWRPHIQRYSNWFKFFITKTQFPIQLATTRTIHWAQGLTLDYLTFDPTNVYKHSFTYTTFSHVKIFFFYTFYNLCRWFFFNWFKCCHGDVPIANHCMMGCTCPQTTCILWFTCINIRSLLLHKNDVFSDYDFKIVHICASMKHISTQCSKSIIRH